LLTRYRGYPGQEFDLEVGVFSTRAQCNWELDESYEQRTNPLEISALGTQADSNIYTSLSRSVPHVATVEEQRSDYVPIFRTQHGLSLAGLKTLTGYERSLRKAVVYEQRYDLHFFLDRRWISRVDFAEGDEEQERLLLFTVGTMLNFIYRHSPAYVWNPTKQVLGKFRYEAFVKFRDAEPMHPIIWQEIELLRQTESWKEELREHREELEKLIRSRVEPERGDRGRPSRARHQGPPRFLSVDIYQIHREIRAIELELRDEEWGI
jgi:hypothetical protein